MGVYDVYAETAGAEVYTSVYNGASGGDLQGCLFGFWEDYD
jgi:hypothetical protein